MTAMSDDLSLERYRTSDHDHPAAWDRGSAGKRSMTQQLSPRPIIFRVESAEAARELGAAFGRRDSNGVADGADAAVDRAAASSGAPLRGDVRARFESSLGADLSSVRVHTDAASAEASSAVGAKAYTVGNDVHFGAGQYRPDDPFGLHLLAHEVAHTQQQAGGAAHRQHKLEVSSPGDAAEHEADHAADAMVRGAAASVSFGSGVARTIQRDVDEAAAAAPSRYAFPGPGRAMPANAVPINASVEGLYQSIVETDAFHDVPAGDPLFATLREFATNRRWQVPADTLTQSVSTSRWGMKGTWNITVTPTIMNTPAHLGPSGKMKVSGSGTSGTSSAGSVTTGSEAGAELGGKDGGPKASAKASDSLGASHGAAGSATTGAEQEFESQKFDVGMLFTIDITGGWDEGAILSAARGLAAVTSLGLSELERNPGRHHWTGQLATTYRVTVPTDACKKL